MNSHRRPVRMAAWFILAFVGLSLTISIVANAAAFSSYGTALVNAIRRTGEDVGPATMQVSGKSPTGKNRMVLVDEAGNVQVVIPAGAPLGVDVQKWNGVAPDAAAALSDNRAAPTAIPLVACFEQFKDGATYDIAQGDSTNGKWVNVKTSVLPTGAATEATVASVDTSLNNVEADADTIAGDTTSLDDKLTVRDFDSGAGTENVLECGLTLSKSGGAYTPIIGQQARADSVPVAWSTEDATAMTDANASLDAIEASAAAIDADLDVALSTRASESTVAAIDTSANNIEADADDIRTAAQSLDTKATVADADTGAGTDNVLECLVTFQANGGASHPTIGQQARSASMPVAASTEDVTLWTSIDTRLADLNTSTDAIESDADATRVAAQSIDTKTVTCNTSAISDGGGPLTVDGTVSSAQSGDWSVRTVAYGTVAASSQQMDTTGAGNAVPAAGNLANRIQIEVTNNGDGNVCVGVASSVTCNTGAATDGTIVNPGMSWGPKSYGPGITLYVVAEAGTEWIHVEEASY